MSEYNNNLEYVVKHFAFDGKYIKAEPYGCGHINDTYAVYFKKHDGTTHRYILQRINTNIFKSPEKLMNNIIRVTGHIKEKILENKGNINRETLNLIPIVGDKKLYKKISDEYWRAYIFIEDAKTYELVQKPKHMYNAGKAFGKFQKHLSNFNANELYETIPNFHNTPSRYNDLTEAILHGKSDRIKYANREIEFANNHKDETDKIVKLLEEKKIPIRVTHNDTKFNNVMMDNITDEGICVIDLDTVMPGSALYDFGDAIRFGASTALEDEKDLTKVSMDINLFEEFTKGFLSVLDGVLNETEIENLAFSAKLITFEIGMRFLTDYINGDKYFKVKYDEHNLDRARTQFKLVEDMEDKMDKMIDIVNKCIY